MGTALLVLFYILLSGGAIAGITSLVIMIGMGNATVRSNNELSRRLKEMEDVLVYVARLQREINQKRQNLMDLQGVYNYDPRIQPVKKEDLTEDRKEPISPTGHQSNKEHWEEGL